ncbi:hypothetical protein A2609_02785 [Candidatus Kaiserbacteria bacterium RIFOXYD1_FULL_47_14]|uniref:Lipoprotein n=1 Tax=Candidatus Kaiserbacteria bacterium RIFOXYD1_FULL_47_14 TaxID=1798533 RepID=A0A1F6G7X7_9BACT|nr:MAG: hypothetical protein A2609_02785 [Candidatus Kaiserbacteria bacterium RIFOXYD1_FULL_47_14]
MKKTQLLCLLFLSTLLFVGCAAGPNTAAHIATSNGHIAGFWLGLWHGMISPITFIISIFSNNVNFYEIHNNGTWYNFGFVLGAGILFGGSIEASSRK